MPWYIEFDCSVNGCDRSVNTRHMPVSASPTLPDASVREALANRGWMLFDGTGECFCSDHIEDALEQEIFWKSEGVECILPFETFRFG